MLLSESLASALQDVSDSFGESVHAFINDRDNLKYKDNLTREDLYLRTFAHELEDLFAAILDFLQNPPSVTENHGSTFRRACAALAKQVHYIVFSSSHHKSALRNTTENAISCFD